MLFLSLTTNEISLMEPLSGIWTRSEGNKRNSPPLDHFYLFESTFLVILEEKAFVFYLFMVFVARILLGVVNS